MFDIDLFFPQHIQIIIWYAEVGVIDSKGHLGPTLYKVVKEHQCTLMFLSFCSSMLSYIFA